MIRVPGEQGSIQWLQARLGVPSASQFHRIITLKKMERSASADGYCHELVAEWLLGQPTDFDASQFMERGTALESDARRWYEFQQDVEVEQVGFILEDERRYGCSPDGLVGEEGGLEIKCLGAAKHVGALVALDREPQPTEHYAQVQGGMLVTGRSFWELLYYHPSLPPALVRYQRDDVFLHKLATLLDRFVLELAEAKDAMIRRGATPPAGGVSSWLQTALERSVAGAG